MPKYFQIVCLVVSTCLLSSCATIFNSKKVQIQVATSDTARLVVNGDTLPHSSTRQYISVNRSKKNIRLTAFNDSSSKTIDIRSRKSLIYWLNIYPSFGLGFLVDIPTSKKHTYPSRVYIDMRKTGNGYSRLIPIKSVENNYYNILKFTPHKLLAEINPGLEILYERKTSTQFSTQFMVSYLLPISVFQLLNSVKPNTVGFRVAVEEKFYLKKTAPLGSYISLEVNHLRSSYDYLFWFMKRENYGDTSFVRTDYLDTIKIKKQTFNFNVKYGYQYIKKKFSIDVYFGIGIRYRDVRHFNKLDPNAKDIPMRHFNVNYITNADGKDWVFCIPVNIRIGRTF